MQIQIEYYAKVNFFHWYYGDLIRYLVILNSLMYFTLIFKHCFSYYANEMSTAKAVTIDASYVPNMSGLLVVY